MRGYAPTVASEIADGRAGLSPERAWWLRVQAVLLSPRSVFFALREDDPDDVSARAEPLLLVIWLAGIASVLATRPRPTSSTTPSTTPFSSRSGLSSRAGSTGSSATSSSALPCSSACACSGASATFGARADGRLRARPARRLAARRVPASARALRRRRLPRRRSRRGHGERVLLALSSRSPPGRSCSS